MTYSEFRDFIEKNNIVFSGSFPDLKQFFINRWDFQKTVEENTSYLLSGQEFGIDNESRDFILDNEFFIDLVFVGAIIGDKFVGYIDRGYCDRENKFMWFITELNKINIGVERKYTIDDKSNYETFSRWLDECGNSVSELSGILSIDGSDGLDITLSGLMSISDDRKPLAFAPFNIPQMIEDILTCHEYYYDYTYDSYDGLPTKHYIDWFNEKVRKG